jgi:hypothetical protein
VLPQPRLLIAGLSLAALVPCVIIAAAWLRASDGTETPPAAPSPEAQRAAPMAVLTGSNRIEAIAGQQVSFPIALDGTDGVPAGSVIAIKGLPSGSNLSEGRPFGEREWTLNPDQIGDLQLTLPVAASGEFKLAIALIAPDDKVIAETETLLALAPAPAPEPVALQAPEPGGIDSPLVEQPAAIAALPSASEATSLAAAPDATSGDSAAPEPMQETTDVPPDATGEAPIEDAQQASEQPTAAVASGARPSTVGEPAASDSGLGTVEPSMAVNLREAPSSGAAVLGVVAKGATLPVLDRKRGWVQVTDPESGKQGWIYSGLLVGEAKPNYRRKRAAPPVEAKSEANSESFWNRVERWLTPDAPAEETRVP